MSTYSALRQMVVSGTVTPTKPVSESSLASALAVSRTPVREALQRLEADGLVLAAGRGVRVRVLSRQELDDVLEARSSVEATAAVRLAAQVAAGEVPPARLTELDLLADRTDQATRAGNLDAAVTANRRFHEAVVQLAGNPVLTDLESRFWDQVVIATRAGLERPRRVDEVDADHRRLLSAIRAGDEAAAHGAVLAHVAATRAALQKATP